MTALNRDAFFQAVAKSLFQRGLTPSQIEGLTVILDYWQANHSDKDDRWLAYILATVHHEVDARMQPISEYGGPDYFFRMYDIEGERPEKARFIGNLTPGDGALFHGRGFVQLTGRTNYTIWQERLDVDLTSDKAAADKALETTNATQILVEGMLEGTFTGHKLADFISGEKQNWLGARQIVHGTDQMSVIRDYARSYESAISIARLSVEGSSD